jgi:hypothetical protein
VIFGDKIYPDFEYFDQSKKLNQNIEMLTPVKGVKGQSEQKNKKTKPAMTCSLPLFLKSGNP